jgi:hypothetical protein
MLKVRFSRPRIASNHDYKEAQIDYLLIGEEQILQAISIGRRLSDVLTTLCRALNLQTGHVFSLTSFRRNQISEIGSSVSTESECDYYDFSAEGVRSENGKLLGILGLYRKSQRERSEAESQLIERAKCLAAIAIQLLGAAEDKTDDSSNEDRPLTGQIPASAFPLREFQVATIPQNVH